jgi:hypothetical protein
MIEMCSARAPAKPKAAHTAARGNIGAEVWRYRQSYGWKQATEEEMKLSDGKAEGRPLDVGKCHPLGGDPADICVFNLVLSVGDISEKEPGFKRKQALEHLCSIYPKDAGREAASSMLKRANGHFKKARERAEAGESLRIWYSNEPDELCGLYWFMEQLSRWEVPDKQVSMVKLPEWEADEEGKITRKGSWGEVTPEDWHRYLALEELVLPAFTQSCASDWQALQGENTPLRATLNGQLVSVPESLYDDFILREIAAEGQVFREAMIVGRVLGKYKLGIGDAWVALRIEKMIQVGTLEAVSGR